MPDLETAEVKLIGRPWSTAPHPFVKWAGGKTQLLNSLEPFYPKAFERYYEPFLGGGAVFFHLIATRRRFESMLFDSNEELINAYKIIRDRVEELIQLLREHEESYKKEPKAYYYRVRDKTPKKNVEKAARLIFLNKTCYNGLYRVNKKGRFNVPFGDYKNPKICDAENLRNVSLALNWSKAKILCADYREALKDTSRDDFIYLDPPYQPASVTANFTSYTNRGFTEDDQRALAKIFKQLDKQGCIVLLSNSDTPLIYELYAEYHMKRVTAMRAISCVGNGRTGHTELIISNRRT